MTRGQRVTVWIVGILAGLVLLYFLFEWAGALLDSGGAIP
ncbi:hypothetical protein BH18ACT6_BH18ACT6_10630 [soil metagenome]